MKIRSTILAIAGTLAALFASPADANIVTVDASKQAAFAAALAAAKDGDTIAFVPGSTGQLYYKVATKHVVPVTIDTTGAKITGLDLENQTGLIVTGDGIAPYANTRYPYSLKLVGDTNLTVQNARFIGPAIAYSAAYGASTATPGISVGVSESGGTNISILNSYFEAFTTSVSSNLSTNIVIEHNAFRLEENDAIDIVSPTGYSIRYNDWRNWNYPPTGGMHPDMVQMFFVKNAAGVWVPATNGVIAFNVGVGPVQGIFLANNAFPASLTNPCIINLTIQGNTILGGAPRGINVVYGQNITVTGNVLGPQPGNTSPQSQPIYAMQYSTGVNMQGNTLYWYSPSYNAAYIISTQTSTTVAPAATAALASASVASTSLNTIIVGAPPVPADPLAAPAAPTQNNAAIVAALNAILPQVTDPADLAALKALIAQFP